MLCWDWGWGSPATEGSIGKRFIHMMALVFGDCFVCAAMTCSLRDQTCIGGYERGTFGIKGNSIYCFMAMNDK